MPPSPRVASVLPGFCPWPWLPSILSVHGKEKIDQINLELFKLIGPLILLRFSPYSLWEQEVNVLVSARGPGY